MKKLLVPVAAAALAVALAGCGVGNSPVSPSAAQLDSSPPQAPVGLTQGVDATSHAIIVWTPNSEADLGAYQIYQYLPDPSRDNAYVLVATLSAGQTSWRLPAVDSPEPSWVRLRALDQSGNRSAESAAFAVTLMPTPTGTEPPSPEPAPRMH